MGDRIRHRKYAPLVQLSRELLRMEDPSGLSLALPSMVQTAFGARLVVMTLFSHGQFFSIEGKTRRVEKDGPGPEFGSVLQMVEAANGAGQCSIRLRIEGETCGFMVVHGGKLTQDTVEQVEEIASIALERAQLYERIIRVMTVRENARYRNALVDRLTQELRTPLTVIKGAATALLEIEVPLVGQRELLTLIDEESDRINRFISAAMTQEAH